MARIAVFGCKNTTRFLVESLNNFHLQIDYLISINAKIASSNNVADYYQFNDNNLPVNTILYNASEYSLKSKADYENIHRFDIDIAFVIGWQRLIPEAILNTLKIGAFGMHGSSMDLPLGRGRSPLNWSIIENKKFFFTNLFQYNKEADAGNIVDKVKFEITEQDTAETLHFKNMLSMKNIILRNINNLISGQFSLQVQKKVKPTYYPKRTPVDSIIDWSQDIYYIDRFIRAVTFPFNGAYSFIDNTKIIIVSAQIFDIYTFENEYQLLSVGEIVEVFNKENFLIKCNGGLLLVNKYLSDIIVMQNQVLSTPQDNIKYFELNKYGGHDL